MPNNCSYVCEILTFERSLLRVIWRQWATQMILLQNLAGCILLSVLIGWDSRLLVVWISIFIGVCELTFSDTITADAVTTKTKQSAMLVCGAMPFMIMVYLGLLYNEPSSIEEPSYIGSWLRIPLDAMIPSQCENEDQADDHMEYDTILTLCLSFISPLILVLANFTSTALYNHIYGTKLSTLLKVSLELEQARDLCVEKMWSDVGESGSEDRARFEQRLVELQKEAAAAAAKERLRKAKESDPTEGASETLDDV